MGLLIHLIQLSEIWGPLQFQIGDVFRFPVYGENLRTSNAYFQKKESNPPLGWKVGIIINSNLVFDYLACYRPLVCEVVFKEGQLENINDALSAKTWGVLSAGTCSPTHKKRLGIEKIGHVDLTDKMELVVAQFEPQSRQGVSEVLKNDGIDKAVSDISIASWLNGTLGCIKTINSLEEIGIKAPH